MAEWKKHDPLLRNLEGFQTFCEIKVQGGDYPLVPEDIFLSVEPARHEWAMDKRIMERVCGQNIYSKTCTPKEGHEDYWERNNTACQVVQEVIAGHLGVDTIGWITHLNDSKRHRNWIKETFGVKLTKEDYEQAWLLFEHKEWFRNDGYFIEGWLAVAEALGLGQMARHVLKDTSFPHSNKVNIKPEDLCAQMDICPIYRYRFWLEVTSIIIPELLFRYRTFQSNISYYIHDITMEMFKEGKKKQIEKRINDSNVDFRLKWRIRQMIRDYLLKPRCKKCGEIAYDREGEWEGLELCWHHILIMQKGYTTKINPLTGPDALTIPHGIVAELRRKLIEGDALFDDITINEDK